MNYRELIQFEPLEGGVRLQDADQKDGAKRLISNFAISDEMAGRLTGQVFPRLRCDDPAQAKALLVVGGHGAGKSHWLSVLSGLAEHADLTEALANPKVLKVDQAAKDKGGVGADAIAGRFKVIRIKLGSKHLPLRDILLAQIEEYLAAQGIAYSFPPGSKSHVDHAAFGEMMAAFHQKFPEHGLLLVVDELVDFLQAQRKRNLFLDLHFLAEIGDLGKGLKFRFMAGIREDIFCSPRFKVAGELLQRVKERFDQVPITARDLQGAAAARLVRKTPEQKAQVEAHLKQFSSFYGTMPDRLGEFVALFPIHPDCVERFEEIPFAKGFKLLQALSDAVKECLDKPVSPDDPGLIAYDSLWNRLRTHPELRSVPEIEAVAARCKMLEKKVAGVFTRSDQKGLAARLIHALCIIRLTTSDIYCRYGATAAELRDQLCLCLPGLAARQGKPAEIILSEVADVLRALHQAVGEQIISFDPRTSQYGLYFQKFRRFVKPELLLHWANAVPFVMLMFTGALMVAFRFWHVDHQWFVFTVKLHKTFAISWLIGLPLVVLLHRKVHWAHIRVMLSWGKNDLIWMVQSLRGLYNKKAILAAVGRFNTGQKINACLVMVYFFGFGATGLLMIFQGTILFPWYVHTALFSATLGSVGGHLFLALINPSTRIALAGIFHGWSPMEYVEHHHALSLPSSHHPHDESVSLKTIMEEVFVSKVELAALAGALILFGVGVFAFSQGQLTSVRKNFAKSFADSISPHDLSTKHRIGPAAESCTKCHVYTGTLPNAKCEACHAVVKERRAQLAGYHGTLKGDCINCHKEHLPSSQSIVPLDKQKFDHNLASFKRDGRHAKVDCDECHKKHRTPGMPGNYYIGLKYDACTACHLDKHDGQFVAVCEKCHSVGGWTGKDLKFAHNADSAFKLEGKHQTVECVKCHKLTTPGAVLAAAKFKGLPTDCAGCHEDPHRKQFVAKCATCHTTEAWTNKALVFDHNRDSQFQLVGKHAEVACDKCHAPATPDKKLASAQFRGLKTECADCHKDPHKAQFAGACTKCHSPAGWTRKTLAFNHTKDTKFPLTAKHARMACEKCHVPTLPDRKLASAQFRGLKSECNGCHKDPHKAQFADACTKCHNPTGWRRSLAFDHNQDSKFPLEAKHATAACDKCHVPVAPSRKLASAQFRNLKTECADCHKDPHGGQFERACTKCHTAPVAFAVKQIRFDHEKDSKFALTGKHATVECIKCHKPQAPGGKLASATFKGLGTSCESCHKVQHPAAYGPACLSCHRIDLWPKQKPGAEHFTKFEFDREKLSGKHLVTECKSCHLETLIPALGQFNQLENKCFACHKKDDPHKTTLGTDCAKCHSQAGWKGEDLRFNHNVMTRFALDKDHKNVACAKCHVDNQWKPLKSTCKDCHPKKY